MNLLTLIGIGFLGLILLALIWAVTGYNNLVRLKALLEEGWSGIDVQLKRRYDLIPNLVAIVKQYSTHEQAVLEKVTQMRSVAMGTSDPVGKAEAESQLTSTLKTLFAVSENYPDLKANENFMQLHGDLSRIEDEIHLSRRYYNGTARNFNAAITVFPASVIARWAGFSRVAYFEAGAGERETPRVKF